MLEEKQPMLGGMDWSVPPYLLGPDKWRTQFNVRIDDGELVQIPPKATYLRWVDNYAYPFTALETVFGGADGISELVALSDASAFRLVGEGLTKILTPEGDETSFVTTGTSHRWSTCKYNYRVWFVNRINPVHYTDGVLLRKLAGSPSGTHCCVFFEHMFVANANGEMGRIKWSDLRNWEDWIPDSHNETRSYLLSTHQGKSEVGGITGMALLGQQLICYTKSGIFPISYVGLPNVIQVSEPLLDVGSTFEHGLASFGNAHFFYSQQRRSFFRFDGQQLQDIGNPIAPYFESRLSISATEAARTYAYVNERKHEIVWVFISKDSSGDYDECVIYNFKHQAWYAGSAEGQHCFVGANSRTVSIDQLTGTIDELVGSIDDLGQGESLPGQLWGGTNGEIMFEGTDKTLLLRQKLPYLETKDYIDSFRDNTYVTGLHIHAKHPNMKVEFAMRPKLESPLLWQATARNYNSEERSELTGLAKSGRVRRYRFLPQQTIDLRTELSVPPEPVLFQLPLVDGPIYDLAFGEKNNLYMSGHFSTVQGRGDLSGEISAGLAMLDSTGTRISTFSPSAGFTLNASFDGPTMISPIEGDFGVYCYRAVGRAYHFYTGWSGNDLSMQWDAATVNPAVLILHDASVAAFFTLFFGQNRVINSARLLPGLGHIIASQNDSTQALGGGYLTFLSVSGTKQVEIVGDVGATRNYQFLDVAYSKSQNLVFVACFPEYSIGGISKVEGSYPSTTVTNGHIPGPYCRGGLLLLNPITLTSEGKWQQVGFWELAHQAFPDSNPWGIIAAYSIGTDNLADSRAVRVLAAENILVAGLTIQAASSKARGKFGQSAEEQHKGLLCLHNGANFTQWSLLNPLGSNGFDIGQGTSWLFERVAVNSTTDVITLAAHGLELNQLVAFDSVVDPGGIQTFSNNHFYYVVNITTNTFQISDTPSGTPVDLTSNGTDVDLVTKDAFLYGDYRPTKITADGVDSLQFVLPIGYCKGVLVTGHFRRFKGVALVSEQLYRITPEGNLDTLFKPPLFRGEYLEAGQYHQPIPWVAVPTPNKRYILVGGRFTSPKNHLVLLDAITGESVDNVDITGEPIFERTKTLVREYGQLTTDFKFYGFAEEVRKQEGQL